MNTELKRYLFIGEFDSLLLGLFSKRGEVIWVSSLDEALNQTGDFSLIILENKFFTPKRSQRLAKHYPDTPLIVNNGEQHDEGYNFMDWNPNQTYQWRIEWGPNGDSNQARVYLDGMVIIRADYRRTYKPSVHWVELGIQSRAESVVGAVYSNVRIGPR